MGVDIEPKFVSFDMNGTLIQYRHDETIRKVLGDRLPAEIVDDFELAGEQIRFDECMGSGVRCSTSSRPHCAGPWRSSPWSTAKVTLCGLGPDPHLDAVPRV